jgi:hypothetical protein
MKILLVVMVIGMILMPIEAMSQATQTTTTDVSPNNPAAPVEKHNGSQLTVSAFVVMLMNWAKKTNKIPWVSTETARINKAAAIILSLLAAVGVHMTFDQNAGTLIISGLTLTGIVQMTLAWGKSYVFQQTIFNMTKQ